MRFPLRFIPKGAILPIFQGRLKFKKWICGAGGNNGYWLGSYEIELQDIFCKVIKKGSTVYDIGANVGFFTLLASELVGKEGMVYAFEPLPQNVAYLRRHITLNNCKNVEVVEAAVTDHDGIGYLKFEDNSAEAQLSKMGGLQVKAINLDSFFKIRQAAPPDYIKIDVEGAESLVFSGAASLIHRYTPDILLSLHGDKRKDCLAFLESYGYFFESIVPGKSVEEIHNIYASVRK